MRTSLQPDSQPAGASVDLGQEVILCKTSLAAPMSWVAVHAHRSYLVTDHWTLLPPPPRRVHPHPCLKPELWLLKTHCHFLVHTHLSSPCTCSKSAIGSFPTLSPTLTPWKLGRFQADTQPDFSLVEEALLFHIPPALPALWPARASSGPRLTPS